MNKFIKIITIVLLTFLLSCQKRYQVDELISYLPLESPTYYKVLKDTAFADYLQVVEIVVDKEYFYRTKEMILQHNNFKDLGYNVDSLYRYNKAKYLTEVYLYKGEYYYLEKEESSPRLSRKFLYFRVKLKKDSIITVICRPL